MSLSITNKHFVLVSTLLYLSLFCFKLGKGTDFSEIGAGKGTDSTEIGSGKGTGSAEIEEKDPTVIVARALLCFNDKYMYSSCQEDYRLNVHGDINVPHDCTDQYCQGPCLSETNLVLDCIDNILENFEFYNKATVSDVKETIRAGCGYGSERGNFNVAEHMRVEDYNSHTKKAANLIVSGLVFSMLGHAFLI